MDKWKKVFWKLLFPHVVIVFLLFNISVVLLVYAFTYANCPDAVAYASYTISAYTLTIVCARVPAIVKKVKRQIYNNKYANKYFTEEDLRIRFNLYNSMAFNGCFAVFKIVMGVLYQSKWLFAMAGYNVILSVMRFLLVWRDQAKRNIESEEKRKEDGLHSYMVCGWLMLLLNIAISVIVAMVVYENHAIAYPGYMIYAIAAYTFACLTIAIINMVKYRDRHIPVFSAVKRIEFAKAVVSIFTLQVAMITQFGSSDGMDTKMANAATGTAVCVVITVMAVLMLIGAKKDYKQMKETR
ncbi:MAG: hypothetical protein J6K37_02470 [Lachnospiraceae bacterium]|nr:hypothetical protein [Lachnospiraceae bacterium]